MRSPKSRGCGWERCLLRDHLRGKTVIGRYLMFEIKREVTYWLTVTCLGLKAFTKHRSGTQLTYHSTNIHQECRGFHCHGQWWLVQTLLLRVRCFQKKYRLLLDHGSENWSKGPSPVFVNDVCQSAGSVTHLQIVLSYFHALLAALRTCSRDQSASQPEMFTILPFTEELGHHRSTPSHSLPRHCWPLGPHNSLFCGAFLCIGGCWAASVASTP